MKKLFVYVIVALCPLLLGSALQSCRPFRPFASHTCRLMLLHIDSYNDSINDKELGADEEPTQSPNFSAIKNLLSKQLYDVIQR